jgi:RNA polymerase sigma-70 factor (ECF subfamily)
VETGAAEYDSLSDEQLMLRYRDGEAAAFDLLYTRHKGALYRYFLRHLSAQQELANELFQDVWMRLIRSRENYRPTAQFSTYLYRIAHNRLVDYWRAMRIDHTSIDDEILADDASEQPDHQMSREQEKAELQRHLAALPEAQRNTFLLKEEGAFSLEQIAHITGVNRETVKSRLRYAINRLKQSLAVIP